MHNNRRSLCISLCPNINISLNSSGVNNSEFKTELTTILYYLFTNSFEIQDFLLGKYVKEKK